MLAVTLVLGVAEVLIAHPSNASAPVPVIKFVTDPPLNVSFPSPPSSRSLKAEPVMEFAPELPVPVKAEVVLAVRFSILSDSV